MKKPPSVPVVWSVSGKRPKTQLSRLKHKSQRITTAVSRRRPLPVQLVHCVPSIGVAPTGNVENVDLCRIFKSKNGKPLRDFTRTHHPQKHSLLDQQQQPKNQFRIMQDRFIREHNCNQSQCEPVVQLGRPQERSRYHRQQCFPGCSFRPSLQTRSGMILWMQQEPGPYTLNEITMIYVMDEILILPIVYQ